MQPFQVPRATIPSQQKAKPIPGRLPAALNKPNIPKPTFPQQTIETNKMNIPPEESEPKQETPEVTPKPEIKEVKRPIEKNPENENESPEQKHPPETDHQRKFSFSPNPDPEEAPKKTRFEPPRQFEEYKDETRVSQAQLEGDLQEMRQLQENFGGFDIAIDDNEREEEPEQGSFGAESDDGYVRVESNEPNDLRHPPPKYQDDKKDYEEIDNAPPNFGYGNQNQETNDQGVYKIEEDQEELVVEEEDSFPTHKVEKEYKISTLGDPFEASPNYADPEQLPPKTYTKPFENEPPKIVENVKEEEEDAERPPPARKLSNKNRYDAESNDEPESKPPVSKPFNPVGKTTPFNKPFNPANPRPMSQAIPSNVQKISDPEEDRHHKSISEPFKALETKPAENREITSFKPSHHEDASDPNLYAAYKKLELELDRERKNNHALQRELDKMIQENISLKEKLHHQHPQKSGDHSNNKLAQKEEEVQVLKEELHHVIENSRLVNDHSNKIISENAKFKEETEELVQQLSDEKNKLHEELYSLKNQFQRDYQSKVQGFESKINNLESQLKFYQENFNLVEEQLKSKDEAFNRLAVANSDYEKMLEELLRSPSKSYSGSINQIQTSVSTKIIREKSEDYHKPNIHSVERPPEEHKAIISEPKPEPKKEEPVKPAQNMYPIPESGGTDQIEIYHSNLSHEEIPDQVRFDSVNEEINERPPVMFKTQTQNKPSQPQSHPQFHPQQQKQETATLFQPTNIQSSEPEFDQSENLLPPPTYQTQQTSNSTSNLMAPPQYRVPHKKGSDPHQQRKPMGFNPQNVQIISGKAIDNTNPLTETEEDKRETPRRENASNASTPTREESMKQSQQAPPQSKDFHQPPMSTPHTHTHTQPQPSKVINLAQKPKMGKNPFADPEDADLGGDDRRDEPELNPENLVTPPTRSVLHQQKPVSNVNPFAESKSGSATKPKEIKFDPTPKNNSKKVVLTQNIIGSDAAEDFFDQLSHEQTQPSQPSARLNTFNIGSHRAFDDSHKSLHGEDPSHRESATSVHSVVSSRTDDIKPNPKVIPVAVKKKMTSMANMFE